MCTTICNRCREKRVTEIIQGSDSLRTQLPAIGTYPLGPGRPFRVPATIGRSETVPNFAFFLERQYGARQQNIFEQGLGPDPAYELRRNVGVGAPHLQNTESSSSVRISESKSSRGDFVDGRVNVFESEQDRSIETSNGDRLRSRRHYGLGREAVPTALRVCVQVDGAPGPWNVQLAALVCNAVPTGPTRESGPVNFCLTVLTCANLGATNRSAPV